MSERWRPVVGFEGLYEVSDLGNVRSAARDLPFKSKKGTWHLRRTKVTPLAKNLTTAGYLAAHLYREGKRTIRTIHSLVAAAFIGARPPRYDVAHGNGNRLDNRVVNLRYATRSENHMDKRLHGTSRLGKKRGT